MRSRDAFDFVSAMEFVTVLDVGSGSGTYADAFRSQGRQVTTINLQPPADVVGDYQKAFFAVQFDCLWVCHVLEHQPNVGAFLTKCFHDLKDNGILAVTVPPAKHDIVGGHLTLWNAGLLLYNLILAGFDCASASVKTYGYNVSVVVRKKEAKLPKLDMDFGDIERLAHLFPFKASQGFDGRIEKLNWQK